MFSAVCGIAGKASHATAQRRKEGNERAEMLFEYSLRRCAVAWEIFFELHFPEVSRY
jgi:hypothetical protein